MEHKSAEVPETYGFDSLEEEVGKVKNRVKITVDGKSFTLVGEETEEHMREVAAYVDAKMRQLRRDAISVRLDSSLAYALTSLNIADEYYKEKNHNAELEGRIHGLMARVIELTAQLELRKSEAVIPPREEEPMIFIQGEAVVGNPPVAEETPLAEEIPLAEVAPLESQEEIKQEHSKTLPMAMKGKSSKGKTYDKNKKPQYGGRR